MKLYIKNKKLTLSRLKYKTHMIVYYIRNKLFNFSRVLPNLNDTFGRYKRVFCDIVMRLIDCSNNQLKWECSEPFTAKDLL